MYEPFESLPQPNRTPAEAARARGDTGSHPVSPYSTDLSSLSSSGVVNMPMPVANVGVMGGDAPTGPVVLEVTTHGLGIGTVAGYCEELVQRNSQVPTEMRRMFTTSRDQQTVVRIRICQGESRRIEENVILGDLVLERIPPQPRGAANIEVTFQIDVSGRLQVRAHNPETDQEQRASIDLLGAQSPEEVAAARERFSQLRR
jgi:molecular chaperone DnaK (HSP70)